MNRTDLRHSDATPTTPGRADGPPNFGPVPQLGTPAGPGPGDQSNRGYRWDWSCPPRMVRPCWLPGRWLRRRRVCRWWRVGPGERKAVADQLTFHALTGDRIIGTYSVAAPPAQL